MSRSRCHQAALDYASKGLYVFPVEPARLGDKSSGKRPLTSNGKDDATLDAAQIDAWWALWPDASVGIACQPSKLIVLDVDMGEGKRGKESLAEIDSELTDTRIAWTGGGGMHAYYQADDGPPIQRIGVRPGIDLIGKGYVVAAPSSHWTGKIYEWKNQIDPVPLPSFLRKLAGERVQKEKKAEDRAPIEYGNRNNSLFKLGCALRDTGIGIEALGNALYQENKARFTPPLPEEELRRIVDSVMRQVQPSRDVAQSVLLEQQVAEIFAPAYPEKSLDDIALIDFPPIRFLPSGFSDLDKLLGGGFATQSVVGVIGPPSCGKSAFVGSLCDVIALYCDVLEVSAELPSREVMVRHAARKLGLPWREGIRGNMDKEEIRQAVANSRVKIIGSDDLDLNNPIQCIWQAAERMFQASGNRPVIIVDYVQLLARAAEDKMRGRVGELSKQLRIMAQQLDTLVIAVFACRRDFYGGGKAEIYRQDDNPTLFLGAAKESGDIEFDCATLLYLDVDKLHEGIPKPARIAVARCRYGDVGYAGARAALDVGKWISDPMAAKEMTSVERQNKKNMTALELESQRLLQAISHRPNRPWGELRSRSRKVPSDQARDALLAGGFLEYQEITFEDKIGKKQRSKVLVLTDQGRLRLQAANTPSAPDVPAEESSSEEV